MPDFGVFVADGKAGMLLDVTAANAQQAAEQVLEEHPGAQVSAIPAEMLKGCNRTLLLWEWLGMVMGTPG